MIIPPHLLKELAEADEERTAARRWGCTATEEAVTFPSMTARYAKRLEAEDLWEVYAVETGRLVYVAGHPYDGMAEHEVDEIVALLESGELFPDGETRTIDIGTAVEAGHRWRLGLYRSRIH